MNHADAIRRDGDGGPGEERPLPTRFGHDKAGARPRPEPPAATGDADERGRADELVFEDDGGL